MKYYQQFDESDCGAACLAMVASYYGKNLNIAKIRERAGTHHNNLVRESLSGISPCPSAQKSNVISSTTLQKDYKFLHHHLVMKDIWMLFHPVL